MNNQTHDFEVKDDAFKNLGNRMVCKKCGVQVYQRQEDWNRNCYPKGFNQTLKEKPTKQQGDK